MPIVSQSEFRANIAKLLDQVEADSKELVIFRQGKQPMVVIPLDQYESWKETEYLMSSPANRDRINAAIKALDEGKGIEVTMDELNAMVEAAGKNAA